MQMRPVTTKRRTTLGKGTLCTYPPSTSRVPTVISPPPSPHYWVMPFMLRKVGHDQDLKLAYVFSRYWWINKINKNLIAKKLDE